MTSPYVQPGCLLLLGAGELARETAISAQRLGARVVVADERADAPAMSVAHAAEVVSLADELAVQGVARTHRPDLVLAEAGAVEGRVLRGLQASGFRVVPEPSVVDLCATRSGIRELAGAELGLRVPRSVYASSEDELADACDHLGYPCAVRLTNPATSEGETVVSGPARVPMAWAYAAESAGTGPVRLLVEEHVEAREDTTLLVARGDDGGMTFLDPIAVRRERVGYRESWLPSTASDAQTAEMRRMATSVLERLGEVGVVTGIITLGFHVTDDEAVFSTLTPGPAQAGLVTLVSHDASQFDLHVQAVLGLPARSPHPYGASASAAILAERGGTISSLRGVRRALQVERARIWISGRRAVRSGQVVGVALAGGASAAEARSRALEAAARVSHEFA